jgi:hypothetical protein
MKGRKRFGTPRTPRTPKNEDAPKSRFARMTFLAEPIFKVSHVFQGVPGTSVSHDRDRKEGKVDHRRPVSGVQYEAGKRL